jgi:hypothetical protein
MVTSVLSELGTGITRNGPRSRDSGFERSGSADRARLTFTRTGGGATHFGTVTMRALGAEPIDVSRSQHEH